MDYNDRIRFLQTFRNSTNDLTSRIENPTVGSLAMGEIPIGATNSDSRIARAVEVISI